MISVSIADTGVGIPEADFEKIIDPCYTNKEAGKGTGLGLSVSYNIVKSFQGDIRVDSTVGQGTTFTIILPVQAEPIKEPDHADNEASGRDQVTARSGRAHHRRDHNCPSGGVIARRIQMTRRARPARLAAASLPLLLGAALLAPARARAQDFPVETFKLENGLKVVLQPDPAVPSICLGIVFHAGSKNERPGITGISHLFEHMMFKGTRVIGTKDIDADLRLMQEQERVQDQIRAEISLMRAAERRGELEDITRPEAKTER